MSKKKRAIGLCIWIGVALIFLFLGLVVGGPAEKHGSIKEVMRDAVLHEDHRISLFGLKEVNPALISAFTVTVRLKTSIKEIKKLYKIE